MLGGQQAWHDHAAAVQGRWAVQQTTVWPDSCYSVCTRCGWDIELDRAQLRDFRYAVATHDCGHQQELSSVVAADTAELALF